MKTKNALAGMIIFVLAVFALACANNAKDSVEAADSANKSERTMVDTLGGYSADAATADFLVRAANSGMTEVMIAELARNKATGAGVKDWASRMIDRQGKMNETIRNLSRDRNVTLPDSISADNRKLYTELSGESGKKFDEKYLQIVIDDHKNSIQLFEEVVNKSQDNMVKDFAQNTLPQLQQALDSLQMMRKNIR